MIAVVMAGGKASRFSKRVEKAVLRIGSKTLLERSIEALQDAGMKRVLVAATPHTPETQGLARDLSAEIVLTAGKGYHDDVVQLLNNYGPVISLNVDVPFVRAEHVRRIASEGSKGSVAAVVPLELGMGATDMDSGLEDSMGRRMIWIGLNHVTLNPDNLLVEFEDPFLTINVNNEDDLDFARRVAAEKGI